MIPRETPWRSIDVAPNSAAFFQSINMLSACINTTARDLRAGSATDTAALTVGVRVSDHIEQPISERQIILNPMKGSRVDDAGATLRTSAGLAADQHRKSVPLAERSQRAAQVGTTNSNFNPVKQSQPRSGRT
jgi:hypothetical protein